MAYDAFISYSHSADGKIAPALQRALRTLAKPWYRLRSLNVFRDETSLSAVSDLTGAIRAALSRSRYFVYLASPNAASSRWVGEEIQIWKKRNLPETLLIAVTEGEIEWDSARQSFNWEKSNALHPNLKGVFSREPLWVDLRWAKGDRNLSPRDPRFQRATAMLAAPMHGKTLDELVGEDVRQHRKTQVLISVVVGALALLLTLSILTTRITATTNQSLQSKLTLIESVLPFFNLREADSEQASGEYPLFERLWSSIKSNLFGPVEMEQWIEWGADRLAVADDCFSSHKEDVGGGFDCPKMKSEFDEEGLRTDIHGLNAIAKTFVSSINDGRIRELLKDSRTEDQSDSEADPDVMVEDALQILLNHAGIILPDALWKQVTMNTGGDKRVGNYFARRSFHIWRKPLYGAGGGAELIVIRLIDGAYCGSRGCTSPTLGFLRVSEKYKIIFAQVSWGRIAIYDAGSGNMPQIFTIGASQSGISQQYRAISRFNFDGDCVCYRPYLTGHITSFGRSVNQRVPQDLADTAMRGVPSRDATGAVLGSAQNVQPGLNPTEADPRDTNRQGVPVESSKLAPSTGVSSAPTISSLVRLEDIEGEYILTSSTTSPSDSHWQFDKAYLVAQRLEPGYVLILQACGWNESPRNSCWSWWVMQWRDGKLFAPKGERGVLQGIRLSRQPRAIILRSVSADGTERLDVFADAAGRVVSDSDLIRRMRAARSSWDVTAKDMDYRQQAYSVPIHLSSH